MMQPMMGMWLLKSKTKPSLVVGDSFSNTASIYFDYNFPIVTNTATTSVLQSLGNIDFEFDSYFKMYIPIQQKQFECGYQKTNQGVVY